ncbi:MAG TPA: LOG family protein, partial [Woeseiaceae bacterium]
QLRIHEKPCALLNIAGYFGGLLAYLEHAEAEGFVRSQHRRMLLVAEDAQELMRRFEEYRPPTVQKWLP